jgi:hypothetical protein
MKIIFSFCLVMIFPLIKATAQVYQFTSDREGVVKLYSSDIRFEKKNISIAIDIRNKKITLVREQTKLFTIISTDTTLINKEGDKTLMYRCTDNEGSKRYIFFMMYSDVLQNMWGCSWHACYL